MKRNKHVDLLHGPLLKSIWIFALPVVGALVIQLLFNTVDAMVVGNYVSKEALAAVTSNTAITQLVINLFNGLSLGSNAVVAQSIGSGDEDRIKRAVKTTATLGIAGGCAFALIGNVIIRYILIWMQTPESILGLATTYLRIYFLGMPFSMGYNFCAAILRAKGDTNRPFMFVLAAGLLHVPLSMLFVIVFKWSVAGVALGTVLSQALSLFLCVHALCKEEGALRLDITKPGIDLQLLPSIVKIGLPAGIQSTLMAYSNVTIQSAVNSFGNSAIVAGSSTAQSMENYVYASMGCFNQAALNFVGQNYGAKNYRRVDKATLLCVLSGVFAGLVTGNVIYLNSEFLMGLFAPGETEVIAVGCLRCFYYSRIYFLYAIMDILMSASRGLGRSVGPMIANFTGVVFFRIAWVKLVFPHFKTLESLYISYPISWIFTSAFMIVYFLVLRHKTYGRKAATTAAQ